MSKVEKDKILYKLDLLFRIEGSVALNGLTAKRVNTFAENKRTLLKQTQKKFHERMLKK